MTETKKVKLSFREVEIREIKFVQMANTDGIDSARKTLKLGSDLTDEEIENLSVKEGIILSKVINDLNGFTEQIDFRKA